MVPTENYTCGPRRTVGFAHARMVATKHNSATLERDRVLLLSPFTPFATEGTRVSPPPPPFPLPTSPLTFPSPNICVPPTRPPRHRYLRPPPQELRVRGSSRTAPAPTIRPAAGAAAAAAALVGPGVQIVLIKWGAGRRMGKQVRVFSYVGWAYQD